MSAVMLVMCLPLLTMLISGFLPTAWVNRHAAASGRLFTNLAGLHAVSALLLLGMSLTQGPVQLTVGSQLQIPLRFYIDGASALMLALVAGVGWVICRFSLRYLDGEEQQGRYFRWTVFTLGAVSLAVIASNLIVLIAALLSTSIGLHQLLVHYSDRPTAHRAAAIKFVFSRAGDACLLAASIALYQEFGTFEIPELFAAVGRLTESDLADSAAIPVAGWLVVLCAVFKSAQFPFHTWLPETMEAPTPVSALMHAGIVNAGGYLMIRMAPIVSLAPSALWFAAGLGACTALMAALVMLSQTSVKRKLAWSTIAQMGFMMLQCGLGAFSCAMLHIIAHSLYKAHAFLGSGSMFNERARASSLAAPSSRRVVRFATLILSAVITLSLFGGLASTFGIHAESKSGLLILGFVLCLGLTSMTWRTLQNGRAFVLPALSMPAGLLLIYFGSFLAVDFAAAPQLSGATSVLTTQSSVIVFALLFLALFGLETVCNRAAGPKWLNRLYVHSSNGFYVDVLWRHAAKSFSS